MSITISNQQLQPNPLFWPGQGPIVVKSKQRNIFLGAGIATPTQISQAIPFDILGFLLSAEFIKHLIPKSHVFLLIADQHAWLANNFDRQSASKIALLQHKIIIQIVQRLSLQNWHIFIASELFPKTKRASYETLEIRDINHFINHHQVSIKIGWQFGHGSDHKTDEAHFDQNLQSEITSIFTKPGVTSDPNKPQESPYICTNPASRIVIDRAENITNKLLSFRDTNQTRAVSNQLRHISLLFERLVKPLPPKTPLEKGVQLIINRLLS